MGVDLGRPEAPVAEEALDHPDVHPALEEMRREVVPQGVGGRLLLDPRDLAHARDDVLDRATVEVPGRILAGEEPELRAVLQPVATQGLQELLREYGVPVLAPILTCTL